MEIILYCLIIAVVIVVVLYFVIKIAVKDAIIEAHNSIHNINVNKESRNGLPKVSCPECGKKHDFDYPKCPYCKHVY